MDSTYPYIASQPTEVSKQICLYALMKQSRLVWEFMLTVIGVKKNYEIFKDVLAKIK